jgi:archaellin
VQELDEPVAQVRQVEAQEVQLLLEDTKKAPGQHEVQGVVEPEVGAVHVRQEVLQGAQ